MKITIDKIDYEFNFQGFDRPLEIELDKQLYCLQPLTYRKHLQLMSECLHFVGTSLERSTATVSDNIWSYCGLRESPGERHKGLALWWATAGDGTSSKEDVNLPAVNTLSYRQKLQLNKEFFAQYPTIDGEALVQYLERLCSLSVGDIYLYELKAAQSYALIQKVLQLNFPAPSLKDSLIDKQHAELILSACRTLNVTPQGLINRPAPEIEDLLELIQMNATTSSTALTEPPETAPATGLAAMSDAVVFTFEEDL